MFVRLKGAWFAPRWLKPGPGWRAHLCELSTRDPRLVWQHAWTLELALALLAAGYDDRMAWLRDLDAGEEPDLCDLLLDAREELGRRLEPSAPALAPKPKPRRA